MLFSFIFLLGFTGALYAIYSMKAEWLTAEGIAKTVNNVKVYLWALAISMLAAVFTGVYIVYPWYRATPPQGTADLTYFPKILLLVRADWRLDQQVQSCNLRLLRITADPALRLEGQ